jgi:hypothetical protein
MRILKFLFSSVLVIGILMVVSGLIAREVLLLWGTSTVRSSLTELQSISRNATEYVRLCRQKGTPAEVVAIERLQLRFISPTEYVTEVLCNQFLLDPIVVRRQSLPPFVQKKAGSSGIVWGDDRTGVTLEVMGRRGSVIVENRQISGAAGNVALGQPGPQTSCQGFGYFCCQTETFSGVGDSYSQVNDCPKSCYAQCIARPVILSFTTDPLFDAQTRSLTIGTNESVTFSYVTSYDGGGKNRPSIIIDYGDGTTENRAALTGDFAHTYTCKTNLCVFEAHISAKLPGNIVSADTPLTKITINVK